MDFRPIQIALAASTLALALPAAAFAGGSSPFTLGIGEFVPTSTSSSVEGFAPFPGTSVQQHGGIGLDLSFGRDLIPGGYQITAMLLEQRQTGTYISPLGPFSADETITQIPVMFEGGGTSFGPVRLGGGLGYDFVTHPIQGGSRANGIVGDAYLEVGVGSGAALQAKYLFGQRAALSGVYVGIKTRL